MPDSSRIPGFYRLGLEARRGELAARAPALAGDLQVLDAGGLSLNAADAMIENVIGTYALPFAVALNFVIDEVPRVVPMVVEEPSIVAAASFAAKVIAGAGGFRCTVAPAIQIGQIELRQIHRVDAAMTAVLDAKPQLLTQAQALVPRLVARGGGPRDLTVHVVEPARGGQPGTLAVHLHVDCCDAMGANLVNTLCEQLAPTLATLTRGEVGLRILSNYSDERVVTVRASIPDAALGVDGAELRSAIAAASRFAELDRHRAVTHNKGIMNGVDAVLLATGQDWRAVEAGAHAFAARSGQYAPLAIWRSDASARVLHGELTMPLAVGTVGGALHTHSGARLGLRLAGVTAARDLAAMAAAAGLATNLSALRALATEGIQRGHMALHARSVAQAAGATGTQIEVIAAELSALGDVKLERAQALLAALRKDAP